MTDSPTIRRRLCTAATLAALLPTAPRAMMAGAPPDSPAARVDPNGPGSPWSGTVSVVVAGSAYSGVVIGRQQVLTASHVAAGGTAATIQVVVNATAQPVTLGVSTVAVYPGAAFPYDDLAVLQLAQPLPAGTLVYPIVDGALPTGTVLTLVGYGASGNGNVGPSVAGSATVKRSGRNVLDRFASTLDSSGRSSPFFLYDFDGASGNGSFGAGTLGNAIETCVAGGDSGSGAFVEAAGLPALYGLSTLALNLSGTGTSVFGAGGGGLVLSHPPYLDWLRAQAGGSLMLLSQVAQADVPVAPAWALGLLGLGLAARLWHGPG